MDDLISRRKAIDRINKQREHLQPDIYPQDKIGDTAYRICAEFIARLPSAQPDCKRPHWIISSDGYYPYCSECKSEPKNGEMTDFCPNCGADMRGNSE